MRPEDAERNADRCLCPGCPTYDDCMRERQERLYCARGRTAECDPQASGCLCPGCPVWAEYRLRDLYFCMEGAAE